MKTFFAYSLAAFCLAASPALAAPGCIGGCLGTAIAAPTPVFPAGYQCQTNWPFLPNVSTSCDANYLASLGAFGAANSVHPHKK